MAQQISQPPHLLTPFYIAYRLTMGNPPLGHFLRSQVLLRLPVPTKSFEGQTVIVTGSNSGIGFECAKHLVALKASKVILAVRSLERGNKAAEAIIQATGCDKNILDVWEVDLSSYDSVKSFAARVNSPGTLDRLDAFISNAGILTEVAEPAGDDERTIKVNVLGTYLLNFLVLPKLRETAEKFNKNVVLAVTGSWMHWNSDFPERDAENVFETLADVKTARMVNYERYSTSKLMQLLLSRELTKHLTQPKRGRIVTSVINPGAVTTDILRDKQSWLHQKMIALFGMIMMRSAEEGGRTLVHAAEGSVETDGQYLCDCQPAADYLISGFVRSEEGGKLQEKLWAQLLQRLEVVQPDVREKI